MGSPNTSLNHSERETFMTTIIRITDPYSLLANVPVLCGFIPEDSLVCIGIKPGQDVPMAARMDLSLPDGKAETMTAQIADALAQHGATEAFLINYFTTVADDHDQALTTLALRLFADDIAVRWIVSVHGSQRDGTAVYTVAGDMCPFPAPTVAELPKEFGNVGRTRPQLAAALEPGSRAARIGAALAEMRAADIRPTREDFADAIDQALSTPARPLTNRALALAIWGLSDADVCDLVMLGLRADTPWNDRLAVGMSQRLADPDRVERLIELASVTPDVFAVPVLNCLLVNAYAMGQGALVNLVRTKLGESRIRHPFVRIVCHALDNGQGPQSLLP